MPPPESGFRFTCQPGCRRCCEVSGYVYLTAADVQRAARFLRLTPEEFESRYVYRTRHLRRLRKPRGRQCQFLNDSGCSIHPAKPVQCRLFPFWPDLVQNRNRWDETATWCPGIGQGPLIQIGTALEMAAELTTAFQEPVKP